MPIFEVPTPIEDIKPPILLVPDWYELEIVKEPTKELNVAAKEFGMEHEKAGYNVVLELEVRSSLPEENGAKFTRWLPFPSEKDQNKYAMNRQTMYDWKLSALAEASIAFGNRPKGTDIPFEVGQRAKGYIGTETDKQTGLPRNVLPLNQPFRPATAEDFD